MIRRIGMGVGGAAIGSVLGWTIAIFTGWKPAVVLVAIVFGLLAVLDDERARRAQTPGGRDEPTRLFPPEE